MIHAGIFILGLIVGFAISAILTVNKKANDWEDKWWKD